MTRRKVVVAMSGGVDSSVAASILKEKGYEVIGATMQLWPEGQKEGDSNKCCGFDAIESARRVAEKIGIPHYVLNFRKIFKEQVIEYFCEEYNRGRTPNPCIRCNQYIKFNFLLNKARTLGADFISTGHYAKTGYDNNRQRYILKKCLTEKNEQSYFLYTLKQEQLARTIFPLEDFSKNKVREYARDKGLACSERKGSQEICFTGEKDYREFLKENLGDAIKPGNIVNTKGEILGQHKGLAFYTVGQREGLGISYKCPLYVISINKKDNVVVVGTQDEGFNSECEIGSVNMILYDKLEHSIRAKVKIRYQSKEQLAEVIPVKDSICRIVFDSPQRAIAPGQSAVFYDDDSVIGGGIITKTM